MGMVAMADLTHLSLFSGIGGLDLAAEWAGFRTVGQCEYADFPRRILEKHWPNMPRWRDVRDVRDVTRLSVDRAGIGEITLISGGFPCQPHSLAGKRLASGDERDLWGGGSQESFASLGPDGLWQRMYQGCYQVSMDGFLDEFCGTWPEWGTMQAGECYPLSRPARHISEKGFALLPTPCASDGHAIDFCGRLKTLRRTMADSRKSIHLCYLTTLSGCSPTETIRVYETVMGFPAMWTSLEP